MHMHMYIYIYIHICRCMYTYRIPICTYNYNACNICGFVCGIIWDPYGSRGRAHDSICSICFCYLQVTRPLTQGLERPLQAGMADHSQVNLPQFLPAGASFRLNVRVMREFAQTEGHLATRSLQFSCFPWTCMSHAPSSPGKAYRI